MKNVKINLTRVLLCAVGGSLLFALIRFCFLRNTKGRS